MNASGGSSLGKFYGYKESFGDDTVWVNIPQHLTFVHISDPYSDEVTLQSPPAGFTQEDPSLQGIDPIWQSAENYAPFDSQGATFGLEALSAAASGKNYSYPLPPSSLDHHHRSPSSTSQQNQPSSSQNLNFILNHVDTNDGSPPIDPRLHAELTASSPLGTPEQVQHLRRPLRQSAPIDNETVSFLLRHYSEGPGHWMDIFDLGRFFAMEVPVKARSCPLLLYSAASLAAKSLGRLSMDNKKIKEAVPYQTPDQWLHKARTYYDSAIHLLREALASETARERQGSRPLSSGGYGEDSSLPRTDSNELMATTANLCVYEFLDGSGAEWAQHLDGAKSLFDIAKDSVMSMPAESPSIYRAPSFGPRPSNKTRQAIFWNIARQDMLEAFINTTASRLDSADVEMWKSAGIHITPDGYVAPSNEPSLHDPMTDDMVSNAMVWLVMKLVNFIAAGDDLPTELSPLGLGIRQKPLLDYWTSLTAQFDAWHDGLPDGFAPISTVWPDTNTNASGTATKPNIPRKWFARPMCASTMQWYHFARIELLHNKPHLSTGTTSSSPLPQTRSPGSLAERHRSYAGIVAQSRVHASEIISIALAQTDEGVLIHSVQPLYAAGQVLALPADAGEEAVREVQLLRQAVVRLLRDVERDTGWATAYRVEQLQTQWGVAV